MQAPPETAPLAAATGSDPVAFGKHAEMSYDEAWSKEPGYCVWTMNKLQELIKDETERDTPFAEGDSMIKRFAQWIAEKEKACETNGPAFEYDANMELVEVPGTRTLKERVAAALADRPAKFYGIAFPEKRVCTNWEECKPLVHGVKGVIYRSFATKEEAEDFVENPPQRPEKKKKATKSAGDQKEPLTKKTKAVPKKKTTSTDDARKDDSPGAVEGSAQGNAESDANEKSSAVEIAASTGKRKSTGKRVQKEQTETTGHVEGSAQKRRAPRPKSAVKEQTTEAVGSSASQLADGGRNTEGDADAKEKSTGDSTGSGKSKATTKAKAKAKVKAKAKAKAKTKAKAKGKPKATAASEEKGASDSSSKPTAVREGVTTKTPAARRAASNAKKPAEPTKPDIEPLSEELLLQADALGMTSSLRILASRPEIVSQKFPGHRILGALKEADGLVNKAKSILLGTGPTTPDRSQMPEQSSATKVTPAKTEQVDQHHMQHMNELRALLGEASLPVSQDLGEQATKKSNLPDSAPEVEERQQKPGLTEEQLARIRENREKAAAKKRLLEAGA